MVEDEIPQPAADPYSPGDRVRVYVGHGDPDTQYYGLVCEVLEVLSDDLHAETGRQLGAYSYRLQSTEQGKELQLTFRHWDLIPEEVEL
ncbi:hypothetical protein BDK88_2832 [Natrinema hispanicum]|uniref:DUF8139 domain-containing protein n=1 Tax=Natrinema hispanicum TaxID=392421 RepID=A0A482YEJ7_9EURY|nr:hypothetical protein [Natrinema hispanicum]RZV08758.1 hypothetical protein BDK88_2832 [Natrinema hispanicum]